MLVEMQGARLMKLSAYDQSLYDNIVNGNYDKVAFRLMPQIESCLKYRKDPTSRRHLDEEIRHLAEIIKAANAENQKLRDIRHAEQAEKYGF
jgi:hypothetical protein